MDGCIYYPSLPDAGRKGGTSWAEIFSEYLSWPIYKNGPHDFLNAQDVRPLMIYPEWLPNGVFNNPLGRRVAEKLAGRNVADLHLDHDIVVTLAPLSPWRWYRPATDQSHILCIHNTANWMYDPTTHDNRNLLRRQLVVEYKRDYRKQASSVVDETDTIVANSKYTRDWLRVAAGIERPIRVIYPPVPIDSYSVGAGDGYFLYIGRFTPTKGIREILDAFTGPYNNERFIVAGDGPLRESVEQAAQSNANIEYRGWVCGDEKRELLADARALVSNSRHEAFGIVLIEALASGTPIVGRDSGNIPYVVEEGETGVVYRDSVEDGVSAFLDLEVAFDVERIRAAAEQYSVEQSVRELQTVVEEVQ